jgi:RNA polymerase sigma factor (sigma-70 family)
MDHAELACPEPPHGGVPARRRRLAPAPPPGTGPAAREHAAAWALVAPYRHRLVAVARRHGLSVHDAQDVAHNVLCGAVEHGHLDAERVEPYLVRLVVARCRDLDSDAARHAAMLARTRGDDRLVGRVDDAVCDQAHARWLLGRLPARERTVIELSVAGETVTGIANATGLSYPTVDRLLSRARKEMRKIAGALGLVGAAAWRQRRLVAAPAMVAVAGVSALTLLPDPAVTVTVARPEVAVRSEVPRVRAVAVRAPLGMTRRRVPPRVTVPPSVPARPAAAAPAPPARTLVEVAAPTVERGDDRALVQRVAQCLHEGVEVEAGARGGVTCAGEVDVVLPVRP